MKTTILTAFAGAGLFAFALAGVPTTTQAASESGEQWNRDYRGEYEVPLGVYTGQSPFMRSSTRVPAPAPAPKPAPVAKPVEYKPAPVIPVAAPPRVGCSDIRTGLIHMSKKMPAEATLGETFMAELDVVAAECAANVVITDMLPSGASYVRSDPAATVDGDKLVWKFPTMDAGERKTLKIWLKADKEGTLINCASVSADPRVCAATVVGKATLTIRKSGPEYATLGSDVTYTVVVSNTGSAVARNVVVTDAVPDGMGGQPVSVNVGDLPPGQSKTIPVTFKANKRGKLCNTAVANSSNAGKVEAEACTTVQQPGLKITKTTNDKMLLIGKAATYAVNVQNTGDTKLTGVVVTDTAAAGTTITSADGGTISGNTATWNVGELAAGATKSFTVKVVSRTPGNFCDTASVACAQNLRDSAQACTTWEGVTGVLLEMVDDPDPIPVGDTSKYTIRVTNQGTTRNIEDLKIVTTIPAELELVPGSVSDGGTVSGKTITWPMVPTLTPKAVVTRTYTAKGVKAGDARSKVEITTKLREAPIEKYESTTVY
jgi:uncharacterized repeat protein (TIGR01451 family)